MISVNEWRVRKCSRYELDPVPILQGRVEQWLWGGGELISWPVPPLNHSDKEKFFIPPLLLLRTLLCAPWIREEWYYGVQETIHGKRSQLEQEQQPCKVPHKGPQDWHDPCHRYFFYLFHNCIKQKWNIKHPMIKCQRWLCSSSSPQYSTQGDTNLIFKLAFTVYNLARQV